MRALPLAAGVLLAGLVAAPGCAPGSDAPAPEAAAPDAMNPPAHDHAGHGDASPGAAYTMAFGVDPAPVAGRPSRITYTPQTADGARVTGLAVSHERLTHLIVVSRDLGHFDHVHPEHGADGAFTIPYTFPTGGDYVLFADFLPEGAARAEVFAHPVRVGGAAPPPRPLGPATTEAAEGGLTAHLAPEAPLRAGADVTLAFHLTDADGPVRDLEPYLGAGGHVVVIPEGADGFLHVHPVEGGGDAHEGHAGAPHDETPAAYGPEIRFATAFPAPGRYRLWLQVQRHGRVHTLPFVLDVTAAL